MHLLDVINKSPDLVAVTRSVTTNGNSILLTATLGGIIVYIYTVVAYSLFRDDMILDNYPGRPNRKSYGSSCNQMQLCVLEGAEPRPADVG